MAKGFWVRVLQLAAQRQLAASMAAGVQSHLWAAGLGVPVLQSPYRKNIYRVGVYSVPSLVGQGYQMKLLQAVATAIAGV